VKLKLKMQMKKMTVQCHIHMNSVHMTVDDEKIHLNLHEIEENSKYFWKQ